MTENFNFKMPIQIRWGDLDPLGHINNAIYVTYFEIGRSKFMLSASKSWDWYQHMFLIGEISVRYHKELKIGAKNPEVMVRTSKIGNKSMVLEYLVISEDQDEKSIVHASGSSTQIMFDMKSKKTIEVQDWLRKELSEFDAII